MTASASATAVLPVRNRNNRLPQLLDAAARRFREHGYAAASMRDIAGDAGMKAGSMYYHFPSKSDLLVAVHEEGIRRITEDVEAALAKAGKDPWQRLEAAMAAHLSALLDGGDYAQVVINDRPPIGEAARDKLIGLRDEYENLFRQLVEALPVNAADSKPYLRFLILGALNWSRTWYRSGGETPAAIAGHFTKLLRQGEPSGETT